MRKEHKKSREETEMEFFDRCLQEVRENSETFQKEYAEYKAIVPMEAEHSRRHKIRMNRLFRNCVRSTYLPFPEVDSLPEQIRSCIVIGFRKRIRNLF